MKRENIVADKSYTFSIRIIRLSKFLISEHKTYQLADQVLRSGTAIGANLEEAIGGQSRKEFVAKCSIAYKKARETHYWLRLLRDTQHLDNSLAASLLHDCEALLKLLTSILISSKKQTNND